MHLTESTALIARQFLPRSNVYMSLLKITKQDARKAMVAYHFRPGTLKDVFGRLKSVQFDPLKPAGSNHDLVLQARVPGYRVGDWERAAYKDRFLYDGWDKKACLVPFSGWQGRRIFHQWHRNWLDEHVAEFPHAVDAVLGELRERGPLAPREFVFQDQRSEFTGSWFGTSLTKRVLLSLWYAGVVMTHSRRSGQHIYDLAERVLPDGLAGTTPMDEQDAIQGLVLDRHLAIGLVRPTASADVWGFNKKGKEKARAYEELTAAGLIVPVEIDDVKFYAAPGLLELLDRPKPRRKVTFVAPLDQFVWDRSALRFLYDFDYLWEVYVPEPKRRWGYYVLPVLWGDRFVARCDIQVIKSVLTVKAWHWEDHASPDPAFWSALEVAFSRFAVYCRATSAVALSGVDTHVALILASL